jgi:putative tricarboxylic transport membrane protein
MQDMLMGLQAVSQLSVLLALVAGAFAGIIVGAIPGMGPGMAIAILLPVTFGMDPLVGLTLLLGVYSGSWYGGAIPAILINTPGTVANVMTTFEGYPLAKRGEGTRALAIAYSSSFVAGIISVLVLVLLSPVLAGFAKRFGSPEFSLVVLFGLVLVVVANGKRKLEALLMVALGAFLGTIGQERAFSTFRFTFGQTWLEGGITIIACALGLFAVSQALELVADRRGPPRGKMEVSRGLFAGLFEVAKYPVTLLRSTGLGTIMGILPGLGEFLAQFLAYTLAKKSSKTPEMFGKGAPEGLIATEASISAVPASAMVPLLALGIPGEELTAMMLATFMVHNVIPGPLLFENRPDFVWGLYITLFLMNIVCLVILIFGSRWIAQLARIDNRLIGVAVLVLVMIGTFAVNYRITDPLIALGFGILGLFIKRAGMSPMPIILGLVLGPLFDSRFRQVMGVSAGSPAVYFERPISLLLIFIILGSVVALLWSDRKLMKHASTDAAADKSP